MRGRTAKPMPRRLGVPSHGTVRSTTPTTARAGHVAARREPLRIVATVSGPRNSIERRTGARRS